MVLKIYGFSKSTCTCLVVLIAKKKEILYELIHIDLVKGKHKTSKFLQSQPFSQVPYINDDGFILYESRAIAHYLIKKYPNQGTPGLISTNLKEEALFKQASLIEAFNFNTHISALMSEKVFKKYCGGKPDPTKITEYLKKIEASLDVYKVILEKQKYLAGNIHR